MLERVKFWYMIYGIGKGKDTKYNLFLEESNNLLRMFMLIVKNGVIFTVDNRAVRNTSATALTS